MLGHADRDGLLTAPGGSEQLDVLERGEQLLEAPPAPRGGRPAIATRITRRAPPHASRVRRDRPV